MAPSNKQNKKKVYVRKVGQVGKHVVWLVDGPCVRRDLDENFAIYDAHHHLPFIPKYEFWIEETSNPEEWHFFVHYLITEAAAIAEGKTPDEAEKVAQAVDKKERERLWEVENGAHAQLSNKKWLETIRCKQYLKYNGSVEVWHVDGEAVRDHFLTSYGEGGHDRVYPFIPKNEVWIEDTLPPEELQFILLHELHERYLMGEGKDYPHAHAGATIIEDHYREHPNENVEDRIREEMLKNDGQK